MYLTINLAIVPLPTPKSPPKRGLLYSPLGRGQGWLLWHLLQFKY